MLNALRRWPIVSNGLLVGFVTGSGDILAQRLRNRHDAQVCLNANGDMESRESTNRAARD